MIVTGTATALTVALVGCSGGGRGYAIPAKVCGIPVQKSSIAPLLPDGSELREVPGGTSGTDKGCDVLVDDRTTLSVYQEYVDKPYDPMADLESHKFTHRAPFRKLPFPGKGAVGDDNSMISTKCGRPEIAYLIVDIRGDKKVNSDVKQRRKDIQRFTELVVPNIKQKLNCAD